MTRLTLPAPLLLSLLLLAHVLDLLVEPYLS